MKTHVSATNSHKASAIFSRLLLLVMTIAIVASIASPAMAAGCWGYVTLNYRRQRIFVGPWNNIETARSEARSAKIMSPGFPIYGIYNKCTRRWYPVAETTSGSTDRPTQQYIDQIANAYRRAKQLKDWSRRNIGKLTEQQFNIVNRYIDSYNSRVTAAKRRFSSTFRSYRTVSRLTSNYKRPANRVFYVQYSRRGTYQWRTLSQRYSSYTAARNAENFYARRYGRYWQFRVVVSTR